MTAEAPGRVQERFIALHSSVTPFTSWVATTGSVVATCSKLKWTTAETMICRQKTFVCPEDLPRWRELHKSDSQSGSSQSSQPSIFTARTGHAVVHNGQRGEQGELFLMGGTDEAARLNDVYSYNFSNRQWTQRQKSTPGPECIPVPARDLVRGLSHGGVALLFGGYTKKRATISMTCTRTTCRPLNGLCMPRTTKRSQSQRTDHTYVLLRLWCSWRLLRMFSAAPPWSNFALTLTATTHVLSRSLCGCCLCQDRILVFGGFDGRRRFDDLQTFDLLAKPASALARMAAGSIGRTTIPQWVDSGTRR